MRTYIMKMSYKSVYTLTKVLRLFPRSISAQILKKIAPNAFAPGWTKDIIITVIEDILLSRTEYN